MSEQEKVEALARKMADDALNNWGFEAKVLGPYAGLLVEARSVLAATEDDWRDVASNWDCDEGSRGHEPRCRRCIAATARNSLLALLSKLEAL